MRSASLASAMTEQAHHDSALGVVLRLFSRLAIVGAPRSGKTTLCGSIRDRKVVHTDDFIPLGWDAVPGAVIERCNSISGSWAVEGVAVARALRRGLRVDGVLLLPDRPSAMEARHEAMAKGVATIMREALQIRPNLRVVKPCTCMAGRLMTRPPRGVRCERCDDHGILRVDRR